MRIDRSTLRLLDALIVVWVLAWIGFGIWVGLEVRELTKLSETVTRTGGALDQTSRALGILRNIPVVGDEIAPLQERVASAARSAQESGRSSRGNIEDLSVLLALAISLIPSLPVAAVYLFFRVSPRLPGAGRG